MLHRAEQGAGQIAEAVSLFADVYGDADGKECKRATKAEGEEGWHSGVIEEPVGHPCYGYAGGDRTNSCGNFNEDQFTARSHGGQNAPLVLVSQGDDVQHGLPVERLSA